MTSLHDKHLAFETIHLKAFKLRDPSLSPQQDYGLRTPSPPMFDLFGNITSIFRLETKFPPFKYIAPMWARLEAFQLLGLSSSQTFDKAFSSLRVLS